MTDVAGNFVMPMQWLGLDPVRAREARSRSVRESTARCLRGTGFEPRRMTELPNSDSLQVVLGELPVESVSGIGARLVVTPTRVVVIRDGSERRPRSGLREWPHGALDARMEPPRSGNGRIVLGTGTNPYAAVSLFIPAASWPSAVRTVARIRAEARRVRRAARASWQRPARSA